MEFIEVEEAYSSQASFLDGDELPSYGEKPDGWRPSGKRVKRGLYQTAKGWLVNAEANAAANLLKKVSRTLGLCLQELSRGALTKPLRRPCKNPPPLDGGSVKLQRTGWWGS